MTWDLSKTTPGVRNTYYASTTLKHALQVQLQFDFKNCFNIDQNNVGYTILSMVQFSAILNYKLLKIRTWWVKTEKTVRSSQKPLLVLLLILPLEVSGECSWIIILNLNGFCQDLSLPSAILLFCRRSMNIH